MIGDVSDNETESYDVHTITSSRNCEPVMLVQPAVPSRNEHQRGPSDKHALHEPKKDVYRHQL